MFQVIKMASTFGGSDCLSTFSQIQNGFPSISQLLNMIKLKTLKPVFIRHNVHIVPANVSKGC